MQLLYPDAKVIPNTYTLDKMYADIEFAARICTHTTDNLSSDPEQNKRFVNNLVKMGHFRPLEFGTVYLKIPKQDISKSAFNVFNSNYIWNRVVEVYDSATDKVTYYITTNYRIIIEHHLEDLLSYYMYDKNYHQKRYTILWDPISRAIADEFRTHVTLSSIMESTRYCNYTTSKFNNELLCVKPTWLLDNKYEKLDKAGRDYYRSLEYAELNYQRLIHDINRSEYARGVLPLDIKTTFLQCGFKDAWVNFFKLRKEITPNNTPHADAMAIAEIAYQQLLDMYKEDGFNVLIS